MSLVSWFATAADRRALREAEAARMRDGGSPRDLLPAKREELRAEIAKVAREMAAAHVGADLNPLRESQAAWHLAQLRTQEGLYEEKLRRLWRWTSLLGVLLLLTSLGLIYEVTHELVALVRCTGGVL